MSQNDTCTYVEMICRTSQPEICVKPGWQWSSYHILKVCHQQNDERVNSRHVIMEHMRKMTCKQYSIEYRILFIDSFFGFLYTYCLHMTNALLSWTLYLKHVANVRYYFYNYNFVLLYIMFKTWKNKDW